MNAILNRRTLLSGASAVAVAVALPVGRALAWSLPPVDADSLTSGTWFEQVKAQHAVIADTLIDIINDDGSGGQSRQTALKQLSYLLTAHSVAEENVLYPALVFAGLTVDSADLYLEQQFQKVWNADIDAKANAGQTGTEWIDKVKRLQSIIIEHAKVHEEADYYPKLQKHLDSTENGALSAAFRTQFLSVKQP